MKVKHHEQPPGVKEIARRANVSIATVDRVIHNRPGVSTKTRDNIERIIRELNYQPNILARRLASRSVLKLISLIPKTSVETDFWEAPLAGIMQAAEEIRQFGVSIEKYFFDLNDKKSFIKQTRLILKQKPDGILLAPSFIKESIAFVHTCRELNIPYVFINSDIPQQESLCYIGPDLFHSGYLSAHLMSYCVPENAPILILNISREMEDHHHLLRKEEGFRAYFKDKKQSIVKVDLQQTDKSAIARQVAATLTTYPHIQAIFVTNSRVSAVAQYLETAKKKDLVLIGYDYIKENISYLQKGLIDFLICQQPQKQGYHGIMALYQSLVLRTPIDKVHFMPIDIITKENYAFYKN
ncbi:LacI family DNA-binding transcriptional regulator [Chitinophaga defluvii]|uniref:Substrate-binding domain-containing protein n=1 Tax=Chitinophaga defluvii TaxID=3163343 RepID=A0ABV2T3I1_9BACT